jgi:hypothetical protein
VWVFFFSVFLHFAKIIYFNSLFFNKQIDNLRNEEGREREREKKKEQKTIWVHNKYHNINGQLNA